MGEMLLGYRLLNRVKVPLKHHHYIEELKIALSLTQA